MHRTDHGPNRHEKYGPKRIMVQTHAYRPFCRSRPQCPQRPGIGSCILCVYFSSDLLKRQESLDLLIKVPEVVRYTHEAPQVLRCVGYANICVQTLVARASSIASTASTLMGACFGILDT